MVMDRPIANVASSAPPAASAHAGPGQLQTTATMPAAGSATEPAPSPQSVGREFVRQYYTLLNQAPLHLHRFYSANSSFVHGGLDNDQAVMGQHDIHERIRQLNFRDCHAKIRQVDAHSTLGDGVVVQVSGELSNNGQPMRRFMQTFVLAPQSPKKYYVHNDIFRYQDEVYGDEDSTSPPSEASVDLAHHNNVSVSSANNTWNEGIQNIPNVPMMAVATTNGENNNANAVNEKNVKNERMSANAPPPGLVSAPPPVVESGPVVVSIKPTPAVVVPEGVPNHAPPVEPAPRPPPPTASIKEDQENGHNSVAEVSPEASPPGPVAVETRAQPKTPSSPTGKTTEPEKTTPSVSAGPPSLEPISYASLVKSGPTAAPGLPAPPPPAVAVNTSKPPPTSNPPPKVEAKEGPAFAAGPKPGPAGAFRQGGPVRGAMTAGPPGRGGMNASGPRERYVSASGPESMDGADSGPQGMPGPAGLPPSGIGRRRITPTNNAPLYCDAQQLFVGNLPHDCTEVMLEGVFNKYGTVAEIRISNGGANQTKTTPSGARVPNFGFVVFEEEQSVQECLNKVPLFLQPGNHRLNVEIKKNRFFGSRSEGGMGPNQGGMPGNRSYDRGSQEHLVNTGGNNPGGMGRGGSSGGEVYYSRGRGGDRGMRGGGGRGMRGGRGGGGGGNAEGGPGGKDTYRKKSPYPSAGNS